MSASGWKNIAMGLGSGLAVGLGLAVMREKNRQVPVTRLVEAPPAPPIDDRDPSILETLLSSLDMRVTDQLTDVEKRLAHLEAKVILDSGAQLHAEQRLRAELMKELSDTSSKMADLLVQTIETRVVQRIAALEETIEKQNEVIRSLREQTSGADENMQTLVSGFGKAFQSALQQMQPSAEPHPQDIKAEPEPAPKPPERHWRMPLVSGLALIISLAASATVALR